MADRREPGELEHVAGDHGPGRRSRRPRRVGLRRLAACGRSGPRSIPSPRPAPGGWGWNDAAGAVPDADDTAAALLALRAIVGSAAESQPEPIAAAAARGVAWLLDLQNDDGGWPTFCRGWGTMPFDRSGCDLTAHALRALARLGARGGGRPRGPGDQPRAWPTWPGSSGAMAVGCRSGSATKFSRRGKSDLRDRPGAAGLSRPGPDGE